MSFTAELKGIQDALRDPELQKMILKIDGSSEPEKVSLHSLATIAKLDMYRFILLPADQVALDVPIITAFDSK